MAAAAQLAGVDVPRNKFVTGAPIQDVPRQAVLHGADERHRQEYNIQLLELLRELRDLFQERRQAKIISESLGDNHRRRTLMGELMQLWGAEPLITINERNGPIDTTVLIMQAEAYSVYVLSQLEIQNQSRDTLVFSTDADERVRACIQEMRLC